MEKVINIDGRAVGFNSSALTPIIYRQRFGSDFFSDIKQLEKAVKSESFADMDLTIFLNISYIMAKQYFDRDKENREAVPESPEEWLDGFEIFSIYQILPEIVSLWNFNKKTISKPKKA